MSEDNEFVASGVNSGAGPYLGTERIYISPEARKLYDEVLSTVKIGPDGTKKQAVFSANNRTALFCTFIGIKKSNQSAAEMKIKVDKHYSHCWQISNIDKFNILGLVLRAKHSELSRKEEHRIENTKKLANYASKYCDFGMKWLAAWINENEGEFKWEKLYDDLQNKDFTLKVD